MDEKSWCGLTREISGDDLVGVDEQLERLHDHVADEKRAQHLSGRVPRHPVDHAKADERRTDVTREDLRGDGSGDPEAREHRLRRHEQREAEEERGDAADHEREARTHGAQTTRRHEREGVYTEVTVR